MAQISSWKKQGLELLIQGFKTKVKTGDPNQEYKELIKSLYEQIGQLSVERDWLKKNLSSLDSKVLAVYVENAKKNKIIYLFESSWKRQYSDRGIRKILMNYTRESGIEHSISPHKLRHFLFTWMKKKGVDDALIQPYSGHDSRQSLEVYSKLSLSDCQPEYKKKIKDFPS